MMAAEPHHFAPVVGCADLKVANPLAPVKRFALL